MRKLLMFVFLLTSSVVLALDPVAAVTSATSTVTAWTVGAAATIAVVLEFVFHLIPTKAPLGWAWIIANLCTALSGFFQAIANFLDKILPQNIS